MYTSWTATNVVLLCLSTTRKIALNRIRRSRKIKLKADIFRKIDRINFFYQVYGLILFKNLEHVRVEFEGNFFLNVCGKFQAHFFFISVSLTRNSYLPILTIRHFRLCKNFTIFVPRVWFSNRCYVFL